MVSRAEKGHELWSLADLTANLPPPLMSSGTLDKLLHLWVPSLFTHPLKRDECVLF